MGDLLVQRTLVMISSVLKIFSSVLKKRSRMKSFGSLNTLEKLQKLQIGGGGSDYRNIIS